MKSIWEMDAPIGLAFFFGPALIIVIMMLMSGFNTVSAIMVLVYVLSRSTRLLSFLDNDKNIR